jgi:hypothetical protein
MPNPERDSTACTAVGSARQFIAETKAGLALCRMIRSTYLLNGSALLGWGRFGSFLISYRNNGCNQEAPEIIKLSRNLRGVPQCEDYERMISGMMYVYNSERTNVYQISILTKSRYNPSTPKLLETRHRLDSRLQRSGYEDHSIRHKFLRSD